MLEQVVGWACIVLVFIGGVSTTLAYRREPAGKGKKSLGVSLVCLGCLFVGIAVMMNV